MTIEERARIVTEKELGKKGAGYIDEDGTTADWMRERLQIAIAAALREQIEECAKVADEAATDRDASARQIADKIRSLCPLA